MSDEQNLKTIALDAAIKTAGMAHREDIVTAEEIVGAAKQIFEWLNSRGHASGADEEPHH